MQQPHITPALQRWCAFLARGGHFTRTGIFHGATRNAGPITSAALDQLQQAGLIQLAATATSTPALPHVRVLLTDHGRAAAGLPVAP